MPTFTTFQAVIPDKLQESGPQQHIFCSALHSSFHHPHFPYRHFTDYIDWSLVISMQLLYVSSSCINSGTYHSTVAMLNVGSYVPTT